MKKILKYFTFLFIVIILMIAAAVFVLVYLNNEDVVTEEQVRQTVSSNQILSNPESGFSQLTPDEQATYLRICNEIEDINSDFYLTGNVVTEDEFNKITNFILKDHPEYFYVDSLEYLKTKEGVVERVTLHYLSEPEEILEQQQEVENWKNEILSGITPEMDNYQVAKYLHDYLIDNTSYDEKVKNNQNLLSVVEKNRSVCAGYAKAYQYLLNQAGIFSTYISGSVDGAPHAWNLTQIDGEYGWIDVTWDDPSFKDNTSPEGYRSHSYFGVSTEDLEKTHIIDKTFEDFNPIETPNFNFFLRESNYYNLDDPGSYELIRNRILENQREGNQSLEIELADSEQVNQLLLRLASDPNLSGRTLNYIQDSNYPIISFLLN